MKEIDVEITYNRLGKSLEVSVDGAVFTTTADSGIESLVEWLGEQLISKNTRTVTLDAKPYDDRIVDFHRITLKVPVEDEVSRK